MLPSCSILCMFLCNILFPLSPIVRAPVYPTALCRQILRTVTVHRFNFVLVDFAQAVDR